MLSACKTSCVVWLDYLVASNVVKFDLSIWAEMDGDSIALRHVESSDSTQHTEWRANEQTNTRTNKQTPKQLRTQFSKLLSLEQTRQNTKILTGHKEQ